MSLNFINKNIVLLSLVLSVSQVQAQSNVRYLDNIPCVPINVIKTSIQKLDTAQKIQGKYIAYTATSVFQSNDLWWFVGVGNITANSSDDAIKIGKVDLNNATIQIDVYATKIGNEYICNYGPGYIQARGKKF